MSSGGSSDGRVNYINKRSMLSYIYFPICVCVCMCMCVTYGGPFKEDEVEDTTMF